ncbi:hypothetical protein, conserved [Eimeria praecox]|uniref:Uncharacterized protein n=1 Tax=Eimeria praecox TaxID=51316 RepID=U6G160_9EIME|nr:hypothetical protein, conserved [Eimeria praecox]
MEGRWHDAGAWLRKVLDLRDDAGVAAQPDTENADEEKQAVKDSRAFPSWKNRGEHAEVSKIVAVALVVILLSGARYIASRRSRSVLKTQQPALDDVTMHKYFDDFSRAADKMEHAWEISGLPVQQAFQQYFTPSLKDGQELSENPLAAISNHVAKMRRCEVPPDYAVEARKDFALHLQLLRSICRAVTVRLEELNWYVYVNENTKVPVPVPGHNESYSYSFSANMEEKEEEGVPASALLRSRGLCGGGSPQEVDETLARNFTTLLAIESKHASYNMAARYYFEDFLEMFGEDGTSHATPSTFKHQIPYTGKAFRTGALAEAAAHIFHEWDSTTNYASARKVHRIADNWTNDEVLRATQQQEKEHAHSFQTRLESRREQMRALLKDGIPHDDLVMSVLFLL